MVKLNKRQRVAIMDSSFNPVFSALVIIESRRKDGRSDTEIVNELKRRFEGFHSPHNLVVACEKQSGLRISYANEK